MSGAIARRAPAPSSGAASALTSSLIPPSPAVSSNQVPVTITRTAAILGLIFASCASSGISDEPDATDVTPETEPYCGNAIVDEGEECDVYDVPCDGPECPGVRECLDDCTLGECVSGTFGIMAGPTIVNEDVVFEEITRIDLVWAGSRYGVFYAGRRTDPAPSTQTAYFTPVSIHAEIDGPTNQILPDLYLIEEIQAEWNPTARNYGILLVTASVDDNLIANIADEDGNVLHDIGILITSESEASHARAILGEDGYGFAWQMGPRAAAFARLSEDLVILDLINVDSEDPSESYRMPLLATSGRDYHVLSRVDSPSGSRFELSVHWFDSDHHTTIHEPFEGSSPAGPADMVLAGTLDVVLFSEPPSPGAAVLDVVHGEYDNEVGIDETWTIDDLGLRADGLHDVSVTGYFALDAAIASADAADPAADRRLVFMRLSLDGGIFSTTLHVPVDGDVSMPSIVWDGEAYAIAYSVDRGGGEADVDVELVRLGCQMP